MSASQRQENHIASKLSVIEAEKSALIQALDLYINNVTSLGNSWIKDQGANGPNFSAVSAYLESATTFIIEKHREIEDRSVRTQHLINLSEAAATSGFEIALPAPSSPTGIYHSLLPRQSGPFLQVSAQLIPNLLERVSNLEKTMATMMEMKHEIQSVRDEISTMSSRVEIHDASKEELQEELKKLTVNLSHLSNRFCLAQLDNTQDRHRMQQFESHFYKIIKKTRAVSFYIDKKVDSNFKIFCDMVKSMTSMEERVSDVEEQEKEGTRKLREIEMTLEERENDHLVLEDVVGQLTQMEKQKQEKAVAETQMLSLETRLSSLEVVQGCELRTLDELKSCVDLIEKKVKEFEEGQTPVGFAASHQAETFPSIQEGSVLKIFTCIISNKENCYNADTGKFTAPITGIYLVALKHLQSGESAVKLGMFHERCNSSDDRSSTVREQLVGETYTHNLWEKDGFVGALWLRKGEKLYVKAIIGGGALGTPSGFSAYFLNECRL